jgi:hypothetical protein
MGLTDETLFSQVADPVTSSGNKVTIVGVGQVGMACAFSILTQVRIKRWKEPLQYLLKLLPWIVLYEDEQITFGMAGVP